MSSVYLDPRYVHPPHVSQRREVSQRDISPTPSARSKNHVRFQQPAENADVVLPARRPSNSSRRSANSLRPLNTEGLGATALHRSTSTLVSPEQRREKGHAMYGAPQGYKTIAWPSPQYHPGYDPTQAFPSPRYRTYKPHKVAAKKPPLLGSLVQNLKATAKKYGCHDTSQQEMTQVSSVTAPAALFPQMPRHYGQGYYHPSADDQEEQARTRRQLSQWRDNTLQSQEHAPYQVVYPQPTPVHALNYGTFGTVLPQRRESKIYYVTHR